MGHIVEQKINKDFIDNYLLYKWLTKRYLHFIREKHADILAWFLYKILEDENKIPEWFRSDSANFFYSIGKI